MVMNNSDEDCNLLCMAALDNGGPTARGQRSLRNAPQAEGDFIFMPLSLGIRVRSPRKGTESLQSFPNARLDVSRC